MWVRLENVVHHAWLWRSNGGSLTPVDHTMSYHQLSLSTGFFPSLFSAITHHDWILSSLWIPSIVHQPPLTIDWTRMASLPIIYDRKPGFTSLDWRTSTFQSLSDRYQPSFTFTSHYQYQPLFSAIIIIHHSPATDRYLSFYYCGYQPWSPAIINPSHHSPVCGASPTEAVGRKVQLFHVSLASTLRCERGGWDEVVTVDGSYWLTDVDNLINKQQ